MDKNNSDIFEATKRDFYKDEEKISTNFFIENTVSSHHIKIGNTEFGRRLNDYDFNLLKEDAYKDVSDDVFKLEYKISKTEEEIKNVETQIQAARDICDYNLIEELALRKQILIEDYDALIAIYNDKSLSAKITDGIYQVFGKNFKTDVNSLKTKMAKATEDFIARLPGKLSSIVELKKSLAKLENINKSVDDLMALNIPYGENINKYEQLSKYIIKANSIQGQISKHLKNK